MFKDIRRKDRVASHEDAVRILESGEYGIMATIGADGYPYTTPLNYVFFNDAVYFHCAVEGLKLDNIRQNNKVSFCVVGRTEVLPDKFGTLYESTLVYGKAELVQGGEKQQALEVILDKYCSEFKAQGLEYIDKAGEKTLIVKISIEHMTAKARQH